MCKSNIKKIRVEFRAKGDLDWKCKAVSSTKDETTSLNNLEAGIQYEIRVIFVDGENNDYISQTKQIFTSKWPFSVYFTQFICGLLRVLDLLGMQITHAQMPDIEVLRNE